MYRQELELIRRIAALQDQISEAEKLCATSGSKRSFVTRRMRAEETGFCHFACKLLKRNRMLL
jgi:hypothetical protein